MTLEVSVEPIGDVQALERDWTGLESKADLSYCRSWAWIGTWLESSPPERAVRFVARSDGAVVGLAIFEERRVRRSSKMSLHLHGTRASALVRLANDGFVADRAFAPAVRTAFLDVLGRAVREGRYDRVYFGWVDPALAEEPLPGRAMCVVRWRQPDHVVNLAAVRASGDYVALLGARTRKNMRRSRRMYERRGPLTLDVADTVDRAHVCFERLVDLHQATWNARGWPGHFARERLLRFHRALIDRRFASGEIQLCHVTAGGEDVGFLYNLVHRGRVYAYQQGLRYEDEGVLQPGRMCDWLAVEYNAVRGNDAYDLLVGDTQMKRSMSTTSEERVWVVIRNGGLARIEERLRSVAVRALMDRSVYRRWRRLRVGRSGDRRG